MDFGHLFFVLVLLSIQSVRSGLEHLEREQRALQAHGAEFDNLEKDTTASEGDIVRGLRMTNQLLREAERAFGDDDHLVEVLRSARKKINRDEVDAERQLRQGTRLDEGEIDEGEKTGCADTGAEGIRKSPFDVLNEPEKGHGAAGDASALRADVAEESDSPEEPGS